MAFFDKFEPVDTIAIVVIAFGFIYKTVFGLLMIPVSTAEIDYILLTIIGFYFGRKSVGGDKK